ncbi:MAG: hypothetical protein RI542_01620 [Wenzhouxiangella sp.]|jgi:hypothetical protein|nr:hypothetical protein [Wenzhouxiangella sp.]MDR9452617.1 hypothetical protein [Wenzhouxiangella sp.]
MNALELIRGFRWPMLLALVIVSPWAMAANGHVVDVSLWIAGEPYEVDTPVSLTDGEGALEVPNSHRLTFELEPVEDASAPAGSVWLTVGVSRWNDSEQSWEHVTESLLGGPMGRSQKLSLSQPGADATPEDAEVYLITTVHPKGQ